MAEKSFGVKEINLIGASGTPTIESPNNLNLNAVNVAISTNVSIGGTLTVSGNLSVGGTITYEDVTNIDSVGIITARKDVHVGAGLSVVGISTFSDTVHMPDNALLRFGGNLPASKLNIGYDGTAGVNALTLGASLYVSDLTTNNRVILNNNGNLEFCDTSGNTKLEVNNTGINVSGTLTVNGSAVGSGSATPTTSDIQVVYEITNQTSFSYYRFAGNGVDSSANDPDLYLMRGFKYRFINNSGGSHPFKIRTFADASTNSDTYNYNTGVTGQGNSTGNIDFAVPYDAPAVLYYQCGNHTSMFGKIYIRGAGGQNDNVGITTFKEAISLNHPSSSTHYKIENTSTNGLTFARSNGTVDLAIGPSGQLGLGGATAFGSIGQVARSTVSSSVGDKQAEWASALYYPSILREMTPTTNAISYSSIPSWVEKITILFHKASLSGTNQIYVKLKNSGGTISSGYNSSSANADGGTLYTRTDSFVIGLNGASQGHSGKMEIHKIDSNGTKWISTHSLCKVSGSTNLRHGAGQLTVASGGAVTGYEIRGSGSNNFDGDTRISIILQ